MLELETDQDPLDVFTNRDVPGSGILLRTDYTNDTAWKDFLEKLREGEAELVSCLAEELDEKQDEEDEEMVEYENASASSPRNSTGNQDADEEMDEDEDENDSAPPIFTVIDPPNDSPLRSLFTSISNLTSLRLLNDVNLSRTPLPPQGMKRIKPSNRLIDQDGLQETYQGKKIWIYDTRSNVDQSVRVVGQQGDVYGTAT